MAANVAVKKEVAEEPDSVVNSDTRSSSEIRSKVKSSRIGSRFRRSDARSSENSSASEPNRTNVNEPSNLAATMDTAPSDSPLDRLNAAFTDDALQSSSLPEPSLTTLNDRIRVDGLMVRARRLFEIGQLERALKTAKSAMEIGESSQIDYSPDDDRPIDLVRRIEGLLEASQIAETTGADGGETGVPSGLSEMQLPISASESAKRAKRPEKDPSGLTRIRKDWSTLFRGTRKPPAQESETSTQSTGGPAPEPASNSSSASRSEHRGIQLTDRSAIVMANRSVSLGTLETIIETSASSITEDAPRAVNETDSMETEEFSPTEMESSEASESRELSLTSIADPVSSLSVSEEEPVALPELETDEVSTPFHDTELNDDQTRRPDETIVDEPDRPSDWTGLYIAFGMCSLLAFSCYRRGAT